MACGCGPHGVDVQLTAVTTDRSDTARFLPMTPPIATTAFGRFAWSMTVLSSTPDMTVQLAYQVTNTPFGTWGSDNAVGSVQSSDGTTHGNKDMGTDAQKLYVRLGVLVANATGANTDPESALVALSIEPMKSCPST